MFGSSLVAGGLIALTLAPTAAQQPTQSQRDAVRAACRSDFMANCARATGRQGGSGMPHAQ